LLLFLLRKSVEILPSLKKIGTLIDHLNIDAMTLMRVQNHLILVALGLSLACSVGDLSIPMLSLAQAESHRSQQQRPKLEFRVQRSGTEAEFKALWRQRFAESDRAALDRINQRLSNLFEPATVSNTQIQDAYAIPTDLEGTTFWTIAVKFTPEGIQRYTKLHQTVSGTERGIGTFLNGNLVSVLVITAKETDPRALRDTAWIEGDFTRFNAETANQLVTALKPNQSRFNAQGTAEARNHQAAIASLTQAIAKSPDQVSLYLQRAKAHQALKNWKAAIADYTQAIAIAPQTSDLYVERAQLYEQTQQNERAIADYEKAQQLSLGGYSADLIVRPLLFHYLETKQKQKALSLINDSISAINSKLPKSQASIQIEVHRLMATCTIQMYFQDWAQAMTDCDTVTRLMPEQMAAFYFRGRAAEELGNLAQAKQDYRRVLAIAPNRSLPDALRQVNPATRLPAERYYIHNTLANAYYLQGMARYGLDDLPGAIATLNQALTLNPNAALVYRDRGLIYQALGQPEKAKQDLQKAAQLFKQQQNAVGHGSVMDILFERFQPIRN
jgi:tetratricopeptide (TPR) repeat protein